MAPGAEDDRLIESIRTGMPKLFEQLVRRHQKLVFSYFLRMSGQRCDAEDLTQECFISAFRGLVAYRPQGMFRAWLMTIARNLWRKFVVRPKASVPASEFWDDLAAPPVPDDVGELFFGLPEEYRQILALKYIADLPCADIARMEGLSEAAVKQRLHRGREMIRERMARE